MSVHDIRCRDTGEAIACKSGGGQCVCPVGECRIRPPSIMSLPMASDTARSEARFITESAKRVADQLAMVEAAAQDGQRRIRATQDYVEDLDRHGSIDRTAAQEILRHLLRPDELR